MEFYELIEELKIHSIEELFSNYDDESKEVVQEYLDLLIEKEYGFITENDWDHSFPPLSYDYYDHNEISNLFIELEHIRILHKIKPSIENLAIKHLIIFSENKLFLDDFLNIDRLFTNTSLENIEIFSPFHQEINQSFIQALHNSTERILTIIFFTCPVPPFNAKNEFNFTVHFVREDIKISACGKVDLKYFNTNLPKVLEAVNYNSCLHKKMGIDKDGHVKNCPLMPEIFGNIYSSSLEEVLIQSSFRKYWNLTKDHIEVCKDCEFKYICTDCRAYTECSHKNKEGLDLSKPLKCGYNPYTAEWEDWSKNPLKQQAIHKYNLHELKRNKPL